MNPQLRIDRLVRDRVHLHEIICMKFKTSCSGFSPFRCFLESFSMLSSCILTDSCWCQSYNELITLIDLIHRTGRQCLELMPMKVDAAVSFALEAVSATCTSVRLRKALLRKRPRGTRVRTVPAPCHAMSQNPILEA